MEVEEDEESAESDLGEEMESQTSLVTVLKLFLTSW